MNAFANQPQLISFKTLRRVLGIIGVSLPVVLVLGSILIDHCGEVQSSISNYYYTRMRNVIVGYLCALGLFLWSYKGYPDSKWDNIAGNLACIFALGVAFFPTAVSKSELTVCIPDAVDNGIIGVVHFVSAASLLLVLASFSLFIFTKGDSNPSPQKIKRNLLYRICGYIMLSSILLMAIYVIFLRKSHPELENSDPVFWGETIALWAFGISWLTKGEVFLKDKS
jgi:hypothetical protein